MTAIKEEAVRMIANLPEDQVQYVIQYIRNIPFYVQKQQKTDKVKAFAELNKLIKSSPDDFDYEKELAEAREEKYGSID